MTRVRIVGYEVTVVAHVDDGDTLSPRLQVPAAFIPVGEWRNVVEVIARGVDQLRQQVEGPADVA